MSSFPDASPRYESRELTTACAVSHVLSPTSIHFAIDIVVVLEVVGFTTLSE
jgi:hypothetical protein